MLEGFRHLSMEVGPGCNLSGEHTWCPAHNREVEGRGFTVPEMCSVIQEAVGLGFSGFVGFHFYNEPCLHADTIRDVISQSDYDRFMLWTNGRLIDQEFVDLFEWVYITDYGQYNVVSHPNKTVVASSPDDRAENYDKWESGSANCWRHRIELPIDYQGNVHLCCQDWRGDFAIGNVRERPLAELLMQPHVTEAVASLMSDGKSVPAICLKCKNRIGYEHYSRVRL